MSLFKQIGKILNPTTPETPAAPKPAVVQALESALGFPLIESPLQTRDSALAAMPCLRDPARKDGWLALYTQRNGQLTGLNLAGRGLTAAQWQQVAQQTDLRHLEALNLRGNPLGTVAGIEKMPQLRFVDLSDTQLIRFVPPPEATGLEHIFLDGNDQLATPPPEVVAQGRYEIVLFFRKLQSEGSIKLYEAKVLLLGSGGAGKTTLRRKLLKGIGAVMPTEAESTHGIEVEDMTFECAETERFTAHLWDFGGQELYHATHQFFLTTRSLYLVVTDERKEDTNFAYWLQLIELLGSGSPVLIVQNERGGRSSDIGYRELQGLFPQVQAQHPLNLKEDKNKLELLRKDIENRLLHLDHVGTDWPAPWAAIRRDLQALRTRENKLHITLESYYELCEKHGQNEEEAHRISHSLHHLGALLHFQEDPVLKKTIILDNEWAVAGVYQVVDDRKIQDNKGFFTKKQALAIWSDTDKPGHHPAHRRMADELLQLMLNFEICYLLEAADEPTYLSPQLLPKDTTTTALTWDEMNNLQLRYEYRFMPKGLASRLMVRLHAYLRDHEADAWRSGAIFRYDERTALRLQESAIDRSLQLHASGPQAKDLLTIVAAAIDRLNHTYKRFRNQPEAGQTAPVQKMVPCICSDCKGKAAPRFHAHEKLLRARERGVKTIECEAVFEQVSVLALLENVFTSERGALFPGRFPEQPDTVFIRELIEAGQLEDALKKLPSGDNVVTQLRQRYSTLKSQHLKSRMTDEKFIQQCNTLTDDLLEYLDIMK